MQKKLVRNVIRVFLGILAAFVLLLISWCIVAGPVTVYRVLTRGDTTIYDYKRFLGRSLSPGSSPFHFKIGIDAAAVPQMVQLENGEAVKLDELLASSRTIAFLVIKDDVVLDERYFLGHRESAISQVFSTSKSILSMLIGAAIDDGLIGSVDDPVAVYVPELAPAGFQKVTIENLLNMQSNMAYFENDNPFGEHVIFNFTDQLENEILNLKLLKTPDQQFRYKSGDNALLGLILDRVLGEKTITQYMQERIWNPLGMEHRGIWGVDRVDGLERTWCCLSMSARDLAKLGRLYLNNGNWNGKQIVPSAWVQRSTSDGAYPKEAWGKDFVDQGASNYKYQWWLLPHGDYSTWGKDGQYVYVSPGRNLIVVRLGETDGGIAWFKVFQAIAENIK